jgi:hypothetical protein
MSSAGGTWPKTYYLYKDSASPYNDYPTDNLVATYTGVTSGDPTRTNTTLACGYYFLRVKDANNCYSTTTEVEVPCPAAVSGFVEVWYGGTGPGGANTACSQTSPSYYLYYAVGDPNNGLQHNQTYYNSDGTPFNGTTYEAMADSAGTYGTIDSVGKFHISGICY